MLFLAYTANQSIRSGASIESDVLAIRGDGMQLGLSAPPAIPIRGERSSERIEAKEELPRNVWRLIQDAMSSGRPLRQIEDYLDWLENTNDDLRW